MKTIDIRMWPSAIRYRNGVWEHSYILPYGGQGGGGNRNITLDDAQSLISAKLTELGYSDYAFNFIVGDMVFTPRAGQ